MTYTRVPGTHPLGSTSSWGQIVSKDGASYQITDADVLWAARAAQFEGGHDPADTLWTWTQRYMLPNFRSRYGTLTELIQAHSQPVNPIWRRTGSKCRPGGSHHGTDHCAESRLRRRDVAAQTPFEAIDPEVRNKVLKWAKAELANPVPRATDFAAPNVVRTFMQRHPTSQLLKQAGNWFVTSFGSRDWPADQVTIQYGGRVAGPSLAATFRVGVIAGGLALAGAAAFAGWAYWRQRS